VTESTSAAASEPGLARDVAVNVAARLVAMVVSAVTAIVIAAELARGDYGAYAIAAGLAGVLVVATDVGISSATAREIARGQMSGSLMARLVAVRVGLALIAAAVLGAVALLARDEPGRLYALLPAASLVLLSQAVVALLNGTLPALRRVRLLAAVTFTAAVAELGFVLWVLRGDAAPEQVLAASAAGFALAALLGAAGVMTGWSQVEKPAASPPVGSVLRYGMAVFAVTITMALFGQLDPFVIGAFHGTHAAAPYALALKCMALLIGPSVAIAGIVAPRLALARAQDRSTFDAWMAAMVVLFLGPVSIVATLSDEVFAAINPAYASDGMLLTALAPFVLAVCVASLPTMALTMLGQAGQRARIAVATLGVNVVLDLVLVPWLEAWGAVIGTTVAFTVYFVAHQRLLRRLLPPSAPQLRSRLVASLGLALVAAGATTILARVIADGAGGTDQPLAAVVLGGGIAGAIYLAAAALIWKRLVPGWEDEAIDA
jgi:O-antigen/teichoic acid export membrane protein